MFCNVRRTTNVSSGNLRVERVERRSARRSAALVRAPGTNSPLRQRAVHVASVRRRRSDAAAPAAAPQPWPNAFSPAKPRPVSTKMIPAHSSADSSARAPMARPKVSPMAVDEAATAAIVTSETASGTPM